jgi:hypothetical protein
MPKVNSPSKHKLGHLQDSEPPVQAIRLGITGAPTPRCTELFPVFHTVPLFPSPSPQTCPSRHLNLILGVIDRGLDLESQTDSKSRHSKFQGHRVAPGFTAGLDGLREEANRSGLVGLRAIGDLSGCPGSAGTSALRLKVEELSWVIELDIFAGPDVVKPILICVLRSSSPPPRRMMEKRDVIVCTPMAAENLAARCRGHWGSTGDPYIQVTVRREVQVGYDLVITLS